VVNTDGPIGEFGKSVVARLAADIPAMPADIRKVVAAGSSGSVPLDDVEEMKSSLGLSDAEAAEIFANTVNALLIVVVDDVLAINSKKEEEVMEGVNVMLDFMDSAAALFENIAGDVEISPVKYNGRAKKSALENLYRTYIEQTIGGEDGYMGLGSLDMEAGPNASRSEALQIVLNIRSSRANRIADQAMQRLMQDMMSNPEKAMEAMQAAMDPAKTQEILDTLKSMVKENPSAEDMAEVREMMSVMSSMGIDVNTMLEETQKNEDNLEEQERELAQVLRQLVDQMNGVKPSSAPTPAPAPAPVAEVPAPAAETPAPAPAEKPAAPAAEKKPADTGDIYDTSPMSSTKRPKDESDDLL